MEYSTELKKGDRILLDMIDVPDEITVELIRAARAAGRCRSSRHATRASVAKCCAASMKSTPNWCGTSNCSGMKKMQAYIAIRGSANASENADVPERSHVMYSRVIRPVLNYRVNKTRWAVLRWPSPSMAQAAGMSTEAFENFYFDVCTMDYRKMARAMVPLEKRMKPRRQSAAQRPGTDLNFSIKGIGAQNVQGRSQHSRRGSLFLSGEGFRERHDSI